MLDLAAETRRIEEQTLDSKVWQQKIAQAISEGASPASALYPKRPCPRPGQSPVWLAQEGLAAAIAAETPMLLARTKVASSSQKQPREKESKAFVQLQRQQELQIAKEMEEKKLQQLQEEQQQQQQQPKPDVAELKKKHWEFVKAQIKKLEEERTQQNTQQNSRPQSSGKGSGKGAMFAQAGSPRIADMLEAAEKQELEGDKRKHPPEVYSSLKVVALKLADP